MKPKVFISHINEEREMAKLLRNHVQNNFLGLFDVYLSTDPEVNQSGGKWFDDLMDNLLSAKAVLVLCSHKSISRPWINFEAGAGWAKEIDVVPICHSGFTRNDLMIPLVLRQAVDLHSTYGIEELFVTLSRVLNCNKPTANHDEFLNSASRFSEMYSFGTTFLSNVDKLKYLFHELNNLSDVNRVQGIQTFTRQHKKSLLIEVESWFQPRGYITVHYEGASYADFGEGMDWYDKIRLEIHEKFYEDYLKYINL